MNHPRARFLALLHRSIFASRDEFFGGSGSARAVELTTRPARRLVRHSLGDGGRPGEGGRSSLHPAGVRLRLCRAVLLLWIVLPALAGCSVQLVADYDAKAEEAVFDAARKVDLFYSRLLDAAEDERAYARYAEQYSAVEVELNGLVMRNQARDLNQESTSIAQAIADLWKQYRQRHKQNNGYGTGAADLDRDRLARMFTNLAKSESFKKPSR